MTTIVQVLTNDEIADARRLMGAFATWRREQGRADIAADVTGSRANRSDDNVGELPGTYVPPHGRLLIAYEADQPAGCAVLRNLGHGTCEVERLFVAGRFRGQGVGRALVERLMLEARGAGYRRMHFGTRSHEDEAKCLCERAGFRPIRLGDERADDQLDRQVLFERDLGPAA
jgi:GNAT superfamily N-acetyltransferase